MSIWFSEYGIEAVRSMFANTIMEHLGIELTEIGDDFLTATMPVDHRTHQPYGVLHGGASVTLAETLGSFGAHMTVDPSKFASVGLEINANHIRPVKTGKVTGTAKPVHLGKKTQIWSIEIKNEEGKLVCLSRITMAIINKDGLDRRK